MCGRFTHKYTWAEVHKFLNFLAPEDEPKSNYNVAPTQLAPVIRDVNGKRRVDFLRWGLIPFWADDPSVGNKMINARADTIASKPSFRKAFESRRCLIPASGFYEWAMLQDTKKKQPFYISSTDGAPLFFAGIWERWEQKKDVVIESFAIITTEANELMSKIHNRMPVILKADELNAWLNATTSTEVLKELLKPCSTDLLTLHAVSTNVNKPSYNTPDCIASIELAV